MTIGERIKEIRTIRGLTQEDLAVAASTTKQTIYKYENNIVTNIPSDKIEAIARCLGVSAAYLMGWEELKASSKEITDAINSLEQISQSLNNVSIPQDTLASSSTREARPSFNNPKPTESANDYLLYNSNHVTEPILLEQKDNLSREVMKALDLYHQYLNALPHERAAVDVLLKLHRSDP